MDRVTRRLGYRVFPDSLLHPTQIGELEASCDVDARADISQEALDYLDRGNSRLLEFRKMYADLDPELKTPLVWTKEFTAAPDLTNFRGNNMWVHQLGSHELQERSYLLSTYYVLANDRLGLMRKLKEDGAFGAITLDIAGIRVSRDLLDSILEIDFLDRHLELASRQNLRILDIGAGYGRLAHRMLEAFPSLPTYRCADVIAESSFVCEYYLQSRGHRGRFEIAPATEIDRMWKSETIDLAINIHSFSECTLQAVAWWINRLASNGVKHLMIVPNAGNHCGQLLENNVGENMAPIFEDCGYRTIARDLKFSDPKVQKFGLNPTCHWLFELQS